MPRYIDADALIGFLDVGHLRHPSELCFSEVDVANLLLHAPALSPDEVRGVGEWIECVDCVGDSYYECSICHTPFMLIDGTTPELNEFHYCPNCGAKMEVSEDA